MQKYYETQIFSSSAVNGWTSALDFFKAAHITLGVIDKTLTKADETLFLREIIALNIELFGIAWLNFNNNHEILPEYSSSPEIILLGEINAAKSYLNETGNVDIRDKMHSYNEVIFDSLATELICHDFSRIRDIPTGIEYEDYVETKGDLLQSQFKDTLNFCREHTTDSQCRIFVATRFVFVPYGIFRLTILSQLLSLKLGSRVGLEPSQTGIFALQQLIMGLHENAIGYLEEIYKWGSFEAAEKARKEVVSKMHKFLAHK